MTASRIRTPLRLFITGAALFCSARSFAAPDAAALKFFENEIRPLLADNCHECHGPQKKKGGLRLDNLAYILQGGETGAAIVKGQPEKSLLMEFVSFKDSDHEMPPDGKLPDKQIAALKKWIAMGAPWPEAEVASAKVMHKPGSITDDDRKWWAYQPVKRPAVPQTNAKSPIDAFIRDRLAKEGLKPAPEASRTELIRRLTFDLHGLPPTPEQVEAFVEDKRPDAYERLVDDLLTSPRFGERQAQHWLDLVRYAESASVLRRAGRIAWALASACQSEWTSLLARQRLGSCRHLPTPAIRTRARLQERCRDWRQSTAPQHPVVAPLLART